MEEMKFRHYIKDGTFTLEVVGDKAEVAKLVVQPLNVGNVTIFVVTTQPVKNISATFLPVGGKSK